MSDVGLANLRLHLRSGFQIDDTTENSGMYNSGVALEITP